MSDKKKKKLTLKMAPSAVTGPMAENTLEAGRLGTSEALPGAAARRELTPGQRVQVLEDLAEIRRHLDRIERTLS